MTTTADWYEERRKVIASDPRSSDELIALLHGDLEGDDYEGALTILQARCDPELIRAAQQMCLSQDATDRMIGAQILAQGGAGDDKILVPECVDTLIDLASRDSDSDVLTAVGMSLGYLRPDDERVAPTLAQLKDNQSEDVRYSVVQGLLWRDEGVAVAAMIELSSDSDRDVRNWATFGVAQLDVDTPEIRDALLRRIDDEDGEIRGEALLGLAERKDGRVLEPLIRELRCQDVGSLAVRAAEALADPKLYPALLELKEDIGGEDTEVEDALAACMPQNSRSDNSEI